MSNRVQQMWRIREIAAELRKGKSSSDIEEYYSLTWYVSKRTIRRYISQAKNDTLIRYINMIWYRNTITDKNGKMLKFYSMQKINKLSEKIGYIK